MKWLCSLMILGASSAHAMDIDIFGSTFNINNRSEFILDNVRLSQWPGQSWGRFQWNSQVNAFVLIDAGAMSPTLVGRWDLSFDQNCSGSWGHTTWTLNGDGSCMSGENRMCRWTIGQKNDFTLTYVTGGRTTYTGRFNGGALSGKYANPDGSVRGCWTAAKINRLQFIAPNTPDTRFHRDSSGALQP